MDPSSAQNHSNLFSLSSDSCDLNPFRQNSYLSPPSPDQYFTLMDEVYGEYLDFQSSFTDESIFSISTFFHQHVTPSPDTRVASSDGVIFHLDARRILQASPTAFQHYLSASLSDPKYRTEIIRIDCPSQELDIIFHALYGTLITANSVDILIYIKAIDLMPGYGLIPAAVIRSPTPLYNILLSQAPLRPIDVYALAARHDLEELAVTVSSHLVSNDLKKISDELALGMGPIYLKRLVLLQRDRFNALKSIVLRPPYPHPPTDQCGLQEQKSQTRVWALATAHLAWNTDIGDIGTRCLFVSLCLCFFLKNCLYIFRFDATTSNRGAQFRVSGRVDL